MQNQTPPPRTPPPSRRSNRPPRINIHNLHGGSAMGQSMPSTAQPPYTSQTNYPGIGAAGPYWPPVANPFGSGNFMTKGYEGFLDLTKSGMSFGEKFTYGLYNKFSKWSRSWFTHIFLLAVLALYSVGGALIFRTFEFGSTKLAMQMMQRQEQEFFEELKKLFKNPQMLSFSSHDANLGGPIANILNAHSGAVESLMRHGLTTNDTIEYQNPWSFWNAMVYSCTIYTTIGYGHITPKTTMGRSLTIIYAIIGIPMFLIVLADLGKLFTRSVKFLWAYVRRVYYTRSCRRIRKQQQIRDAMTGFNTVYDMAIRRPSRYFAGGADVDSVTEPDAEIGKGLSTSHPETPTSPYPETFEVDDEFNLPVSVASLLLITYILMGSIGYQFVEDGWQFLDSFYFVFISMSTIGFGDLVPSNPFIVMVSMIYLIFGLALTSMFINVVQIKLSDHFKRASAKVGATIGMNMASEMGDEQDSSGKTPTDLASVHGSRLGRIEEDGTEMPSNGAAATNAPLPPILRSPRPQSPLSQDIAPPLLPKRQAEAQPPPPAEPATKKKYRFF